MFRQLTSKSNMFRQLAVLSAIAASAVAAPNVTFADGATITGSDSSSQVESFRGIPFGQAPVGDLRFKHPLPYNESLDGLQATNFGPQCWQESSFTIDTTLLPSQLESYLNGLLGQYTDAASNGYSEDCLNLNVFRPAGTNATANLPVMFWIFGGGFEDGGANSYDPTMLIQESISMDQPIIFVSMNYRLGAYGFIGGSDIVNEGQGNAGLVDQRLAMQWVADNIAAFGGNPDDVTIFGESAGSISVGHQLVMYDGDNTYKGKPLFHAAIMQSGSVIPVANLDSKAPQNIYNELLNYAGCSQGSGALACLRALSPQDLNVAMNKLPGIFSYESLLLSFMPRYDGTVISELPHDLVKAGKYARVPFIIGDQEDEGTLFSLTQFNVTSNALLYDYIAVLLENTNTSDIMSYVNTYPDDPWDGSPYETGIFNVLYPQFKRIAAILGDYVFQSGRRFMLENIKDVDTYSFLARSLYGVPFLGTFHGSDVLMIYDFPDAVLSAKAYRQYWVSFANNKNPNVGTTVTNWPKYSSGQQNLVLNELSLNPEADNFRVDEISYLLENIHDFLA